MKLNPDSGSKVLAKAAASGAQRVRLLGMARVSRLSLGFYLRHGFDSWERGDVMEMRKALLGSLRCEHVIRLATAMA